MKFGEGVATPMKDICSIARCPVGRLRLFAVVV